MGALFCLGLLLFAPIVFRRRSTGSPVLAKLLWVIYFGLGVSATFIAATDVLRPVFEPNYAAALFLALCILIGISGFQGFRARDVGNVITSIRAQGQIEGVLIGTQLYAGLFFLPFAISSLTGDANENRLDLTNKMEVLGSFGIFNTFAGAASQLFGASLVLACVRLSQPDSRGRNLLRAYQLIFASLSYVIYVLAYVGRDGVVYWLMTALAVFVVFRGHMPVRLRRRIVTLGTAMGALMLLPIIAITAARFVDTDHGSAWSILDYFGSQISNFGDYSTLDRPLTFGIMNFPMFIEAACSVTGIAGCENWDDLKLIIFDQYLAQGKEPWLFGTYVSDFVGDFGYLGTLVLLSGFALLCRVACRTRERRPMTITRLLLVFFLFLVPYWGVFYFRFSITNGFIVVNLAFIAFVWLLQKFGSRLPVAAGRVAVMRPSGRN
jgi:hypothetical protein